MSERVDGRAYTRWQMSEQKEKQRTEREIQSAKNANDNDISKIED